MSKNNTRDWSVISLCALQSRVRELWGKGDSGWLNESTAEIDGSTNKATTILQDWQLVFILQRNKKNIETAANDR
jgi:hypothetical protein